MNAPIITTEASDIGRRFHEEVALLVEREPKTREMTVGLALFGLIDGLQTQMAKDLMRAVMTAECEHIRAEQGKAPRGAA